ncbi:MAG: peptide deformylase [Chitinivibrionales bacterium]
MFNIRHYGDPVLRKKADRVLVFDDALRDFVKKMIVTMREHDGVGLAAPQVGRSIQCAIVEPSKETPQTFVLINPEIVSASKETAENEEGCLSFPDLHLMLTRPKIVSVKAFDENGREYTIEKAEGLFCRALQHEIDHLNGLFIIDHISLLQRKLLKGKLRKILDLQSDETALRGNTANAV